MDQTWSATGYLGAVISGVFGIEPGEDGVMLRPCVPEDLADSALYDLNLRGWELTVKLRGFGTQIERMTLDGAAVQNPIPYGRPGSRQILEISLRR